MLRLFDAAARAVGAVRQTDHKSQPKADGLQNAVKGNHSII